MGGTGPDDAGPAAGGEGGPAGYSFGVGGPAAERLLLLAEVFAPSMAAVLGTLPARAWGRVLDLGCGPGSSTAHLVAALPGSHVIGLDAAVAFVERARQRVAGASFAVADVTAPLPGPPADLVYARFLLSHLPAPLDVARAWARQLAVGGRLVLEEPERIDTGDDVFAEYLALTGAVVARRGAAMLVGPTLAGLEEAELNRVVTLDVEPADAARLFRLNLRSMGGEVVNQGDLDDEVVARLDAGLRARERSGAAPITWQLRQVVLGAAD